MLLRGQALGLGEARVPLILALMNLVAAALSAPVGRLSDSIGRRGLVVIGFAALVLAQGALAAATTPVLVFLGASLWGVHLGVTQGVLSALVADLAPADLRGTAFGVFHLMSGLAILIGSSAAGWVWDAAGAGAMFALAAAVSLLGLVVFLVLPADRAGAA
jgi:MFS family permease